jgi:hypothetical protein
MRCCFECGGSGSSAAGCGVVAVHLLCWPPWWWFEGVGLGFVVAWAQRASKRRCSPMAIGGASPPSRRTHRMKGIRSPLPRLGVPCIAGPSGVVPGVGAAADRSSVGFLEEDEQGT